MALDIALPSRSRRELRGPRVPTGLRRLAGPLLLLTVWQVGSSLGLLGEQTLAAPSAIVSAGADLVSSGELAENLWISLVRALTGLAIGVTAGTVFALVAGLSRVGEDLVDG